MDDFKNNGKNVANGDRAAVSDATLQREIAAHEATLRELRDTRADLEERVAERTRELTAARARLETALRAANVYVFSQDRELRYTWVYSPHGDTGGDADILGRTDADILPASMRDTVIALKHSVIASGAPAGRELSYLLPSGSTLVFLHVDPAYAPDGTVDGVTCAAMDISRTRSLESEQQRLGQELATVVQRYETALRGSSVTVFTQDKDLRYTSVSNTFVNRSVDDIIGQADEGIFPAATAAAVADIKRRALDTGEAQDGEVKFEAGEQKWFDFHVEPLRDMTGRIVGLTGTAVDVTSRKESEAHLRLLMRELTHRSKNLLAVIQAMARQTARHAADSTHFLDQFGARLQALSSSHDLLVQESWYGASLVDLVRSQLGRHLDDGHNQVAVEGPPVLLKPEAAQALGLALHELATNAAKFGALSTADGQVLIVWRRIPGSDSSGVDLTWHEKGGPPVAAPTKRGFGSMVIERNLALTLDAAVDLAFDPAGLRFHINIPVSHFVAGR